MSYYVGGTHQFTHAEKDSSGNPLPQSAGRWSTSDPAIASIATTGLATWLAPGAVTIVYTLADYTRVGAQLVEVLSAPAASLSSTPSSLTVGAGSVAELTIAGLDAGSTAIDDLVLDSVTSSDATLAKGIILGDKVLVIGVAEGSATLTIGAGSATVDVAVTVTPAASGGGGGAVSSVFARTGAVVKAADDYAVGDITGAASAASVTSEAATRASADTTLQTNIDAEAATRATADALLAPLASPSLTGTPTVPTATALTNTTQAASTAYADAAVAVEAGARGTAVTAEASARAAADALLAPLASPALTGTPTAPTPSAGDNATHIATTAYVDAAVASLVAAAPGTMDTLKEIADALADDPNYAATMTTALALKAPLASPSLTGVPLAPTAAGGTNTTQIASTAFVHGEVATEAAARATSEALLAPLASPALTGTPTAPTQLAGNNTTRIATTAFVTAAVAAGPVTSVFGRTGAVVKVSGDYAVADVTGAAPLASPALTGTPTAPTAAASTNTTQVATTAYADAAVAVETSARGTAVTAEASARSTADALLAPLASPAFTGHPVGVTEAALNNSTRLASTAYADAAVAVENSRATTAEALLAPKASPTFTGVPTVPTATALTNTTQAASTAYADAAVAVEASRAATAEALLAPLASPALTGTPTAPTQTAGNNTTRVATTAFVTTACASAGAVTSVFGRTGVVVKSSGDYAVADVTGAAALASPALTGTPTAPTATALTNTTQIATTAYADAIGTLKANIASPTFTGAPAAPTPTAADNSTKIATTAYVDAADNLQANLASPALTGTPTAPTAAAGDSSTKIATTAFVADNDMGLAERYDVTSGALAATYPRGMAVTSSALAAGATGVLNVTRIFLRKGLSLSAIRFFSGGSAGTAMTHQWFALFDSSKNKLAVTADDTSTAWSANTMKSLSITGGPFVTTYTGWYYIGYVITFTTTAPTMAGIATSAIASVEGAAPIVGGSADTGLTTPATCPATIGTITLTVKRYYVEVA